MALESGTQLGHYEITDQIGKGGMGEVYRARDTKLGREVAIKVLPAEFSQDEERLARLEREARMLAALNHPNIAAIYGLEQSHDTCFLVLELVGGETLADRLKRGAIPVEESLKLALQIADALGSAHGRSVIHRDLKPANIKVTGEGKIKLLDFGLAKLVEVSPFSDGVSQLQTRETPASLTQEGTLIGTPNYMAPEQLEGKDADMRSDVFAFGSIVYEMITGTRAFGGENQASLIAAVLKDEPAAVSGLQPDVYPELARAIDRCLAKNAEERWQSGGELHAHLQAELQGRLTGAAATPARRLQPRRILVPILASMILLSAGWFLSRLLDSGPALEEGTTQLEAYIADSDWESAYALARRLEAVAPEDPALQQLLWSFSTPYAIDSDPPGAVVFRRGYGGSEEDWVELGATPIAGVRIPVGVSRLRLELEGFDPLVRTVAGPTSPGTVVRETVEERNFTLSETGSLPAGMVRVPGWQETVQGVSVRFADFLIGTYEVSNREFKNFVDDGGYEQPEFWGALLEEQELTFEEAMDLFVDRYGLNGPSTWEGGYPEGQDDYPVSGVNAYEAAAYAQWAGGRLPTFYHWRRAFVGDDGPPSVAMLSESNLESPGPAQRGAFDSPSPFGAYDMAGNVREWVMNSVGDQRYALGGSWPEYYYIPTNLEYSLPPFDRHETNGFRLAFIDDEPAVMELAGQGRLPVEPNYSGIEPISDDRFEGFLSLYAYDESGSLDPVPGPVLEFPYGTREQVTIDAAYDDERLPLYIYTPRNRQPPYGTVVLIPGNYAWQANSFDQARFSLDHLVRGGYAVVWPVVKGTYGRTGGVPFGETVQARDTLVAIVKDIRRTMDYLLTQPDRFDPEALGYYGLSLGASIAPNVLVSETRFRFAVINLGGLPVRIAYREEVHPMYYLPRVTQSVLMFSAELDPLVPLQTAAVPFFELLGSADRTHRVVPGGHGMRTSEQARQTLEWLDERFAPAR